MGFPRQEYWSGLPFLTPGDLLNPRIKPTPPALEEGLDFFFPLHHLGKEVNNLMLMLWAEIS